MEKCWTLDKPMTSFHSVNYLRGVRGLCRQVRFQNHIAGINRQVDKDMAVMAGGLIAVIGHGDWSR